jgi:hypothetical protein
MIRYQHLSLWFSIRYLGCSSSPRRPRPKGVATRLTPIKLCSVSPSCQIKNASRGRGKSWTHSSPGVALPTGAAPPVDPPAAKLSFRLLRSALQDLPILGSRTRFHHFRLHVPATTLQLLLAHSIYIYSGKGDLLFFFFARRPRPDGAQERLLPSFKASLFWALERVFRAPWQGFFRPLSGAQNLLFLYPRGPDRVSARGGRGKPLSPTEHWNLQHTSGVQKGQAPASNNTSNRCIKGFEPRLQTLRDSLIGE